MVTTTLAALLLAQASPSPGPLVSKMLARYSEAKALSGVIVFTQSAAGKSVTVKTDVQYERPSKLFIQQSTTVPEQAVYRVISDGRTFSYDRPPGIFEDKDRLYESVMVGGKALDIGEIYAAASLSLADKSAPLDIAIARLADLQFVTSQWASIRYHGTTQIDGQKAHIITGEWRQYGRAPVSGTYEIAISESDDLLSYTLNEVVSAPGAGAPVAVTSNWRVKLRPGATPDVALFKVS